jgi:hypothetical protein
MDNARLAMVANERTKAEAQVAQISLPEQLTALNEQTTALLAVAGGQHRLAEDAAKQAERLEKQIVELVGIAAEQKRLAAKLDMQTDTLISLTRWLRGLTIGLVVLAIPLFLEALHFVESSKKPIKADIATQQTNNTAPQQGAPANSRSRE